LKKGTGTVAERPGGCCALITVGALEAEAIASLGSPGGNVVLAGNSLRLYDEALKIVADAINNNLSIEVI
jgi:hypothetical protein